MVSRDTGLSRRAFLRTAAGASAVTASGTAVAQQTGTPTGAGTPSGSGTGTPAGPGTGTPSGTATGTDGASTDAGGGGSGGGGPPDFGGFLDPVGNFDGTVVDARGQDSVPVAVGAQGNGGAFAFDPPAVHVDNGATVVWEWTGDGGGHNVVSAPDGPLDSGEPVASEGTTYEYMFESDGIYNYICEPHESLGMKASVVVGTEYPTQSTDGGGDGGGSPAVPNSAKTLGVATAVVIAATLGLTYVFIRYGGDYEVPGTE